MRQERMTIGVDLGGTRVRVAVVDGCGAIVEQVRRETAAKRGPEGVRAQIREAVAELRQAAGVDPLAVGVGVAGQVSAAGVVRFAPNLGWRDVPLQADLERELKLPVTLLNDVRAATWGEWLHGAGRGCDDLLCLFVGTGIGGGLVSGGRVLDGASNTAGEFGHLTVDLHGPPCTCGNRGCLEALAGGWAIARRAREAVDADPEAGRQLLQRAAAEGEELSAGHVARAARAGDPLAARLVDEVARALGAGAAGLVNAFNPARLLLGGGVIDGLPELVGRVERGLRERALQAACEKLQILAAGLGSDAGVIGAGAVALSRFAENGGDDEHTL